MSPLKNIILVSFLAFWLFLCSCGQKAPEETTSFTRADSLMDIYLSLQDSLLASWNTMIYDDNQKIKAMNHLLHELQVTGDLSPEESQNLKSRIDQLLQIRYTSKTMWNNDIITEYDFASESLVNELISKTESISSFTYNSTMQSLVEDIRASELRINNYRDEYDEIAMRYNQFLEENKDHLKEICEEKSVAKKALFQIAEE